VGVGASIDHRWRLESGGPKRERGQCCSEKHAGKRREEPVN